MDGGKDVRFCGQVFFFGFVRRARCDAAACAVACCVLRVACCDTKVWEDRGELGKCAMWGGYVNLRGTIVNLDNGRVRRLRLEYD
jgi:hypothetical protein